MRIVQVNYVYHPDDADPDAVLARYTVQTRWGRAVLDAGAEEMAVVQGFSRDAALTRDGIDYRLVAGEPALARAMMDLRPDLVHIHGLGYPRRVWGMRRGLPREAALVVQDHGWYGHGIPATRNPLEWLTYRRGLAGANGFFFSAAGLAEPWRRARLIRGSQPVYELAEVSVDLRALPRAAARAASGLQGDPALLWVGRLNATKDPLTVLDGLARALPALPRAHLTLAYGNDALLPQVQARAAGPDLAGHVTLVGAVPYADLAAYYSAADIFVLGSAYESTGNALLEALACGAIPVVTDIPPFRRFTFDGALGALWPPGDAAALADALQRAAGSDREGMRRACIDHFEAELTWAALGRQAWAAYQDVHARQSKA